MRRMYNSYPRIDDYISNEIEMEQRERELAMKSCPKLNLRIRRKIVAVNITSRTESNVIMVYTGAIRSEAATCT